MRKYAIELAYDGSGFCGWQTQRGTGKHANAKPSVEAHLVDAIHTLVGEAPTVVASGRTDAGVHASGQVAHFCLENQSGSDENMLRGLNHLLPDAIQIHQLGLVPDDFRANRASQKQYSYYFQMGPSNVPHLRAYTMWNHYQLDGELMAEATRHLVGEHDFGSFCSAGANVSSTKRIIYAADITKQPIEHPGCFDSDVQYLWRLRLTGNGFLKQMVRSIAGTLKQIGENRRSPDDVHELVTNPLLRDQAGPTAPANGLWLDRVWYAKREGIDFLHQV